MRLNIRTVYMSIPYMYGLGALLFIVGALRLFMVTDETPLLELDGDRSSTVDSNFYGRSSTDQPFEKLSEADKLKLIMGRMTAPKSHKQKLIVITTFMRSGSTFVGELFNLHSDVFYQFEPLHPNASVQGF